MLAHVDVEFDGEELGFVHRRKSGLVEGEFDGEGLGLKRVRRKSRDDGWTLGILKESWIGTFCTHIR